MPYSPIQPDGDGRHDERVPEEQRRLFVHLNIKQALSQMYKAYWWLNIQEGCCPLHIKILFETVIG